MAAVTVDYDNRRPGNETMPQRRVIVPGTGGPGGTIAPGMVFGFLAGRHAAGMRA